MACLAGLSLCLVLIHGAGPGPVARSKKLIEMGWDEPDTRFMRQHRAQMDRTPFDGCVFHVSYPKPDSGQGNFAWEVWGRRAFTMRELWSAREDLRLTRFRSLKHNFLRINVTPGDLDWFDDFSAVRRNVRLAARLAKVGRCDGLMLDVEQYQSHVWEYDRQRDAKRRSWNEYAAQARRRGRELMQAMQVEFPDLTLFMTFGYSLPWHEHLARRRRIEQCDYGLLAPFMDGLIDGARGRTRIVDGYELSFSYRDTADFRKAYRKVKRDLLPIVADTLKYARRVSVGFALWMDHEWRQNGWNVSAPEKNFFPPEVFQRSLREALRVADEYVWVYTETPHWWSSEGGPARLPAPYDTAVRRAAAEAAAPSLGTAPGPAGPR